jgi:hypothetical protein
VLAEVGVDLVWHMGLSTQDIAPASMQAALDQRARFPGLDALAPSIPDYLAYLHAAPLAHILSLLCRQPGSSDAPCLAQTAYATLTAVAQSLGPPAAAADMLQASADAPAACMLPERALLATLAASVLAPHEAGLVDEPLPVASLHSDGDFNAIDALTNPNSANDWAVALVDALLASSDLAQTPLAAYAPLAAASPALSRALLPLLFVTAALAPLADSAAPMPRGVPVATAAGDSDEALSALGSKLSRLLAEHVFPPTHAAAARLERGHSSNAASAGSTWLSPTRLEVMRLALQCLAALCAVSTAARLTMSAFVKGASAEAEQARMVIEWDSTYWLHPDYLQV